MDLLMFVRIMPPSLCKLTKFFNFRFVKRTDYIGPICIWIEIYPRTFALNTKLVGFEVYTAVNEGATDFCLLQNVQTGSEAHPASCSVGTGVLSLRQSGWGVKFTTHFCLVQRLTINGAIPLLPHMPLWREQGTLYCCENYRVCDVTPCSIVESFHR
jgi:hypothetical protein